MESKTDLKYTDWAKDLPPKGDKSRFAPKLTFDERCAWFALYHANPDKVSVSDIAEATGISDPVASALLNIHHRRYKNVKIEFKKLGLTSMYQKYVENRHIERIQAIKAGRNKRIPKPGTISLGGHDFVITQREDGKWAATTELLGDAEVGRKDTWDEIVEECIQAAKFL